MLGEIKKSVDTASRNPNRFKLTNVEIQGRRGWMDAAGRRVETLRSQVWALVRVNTGANEFTSTSASGANVGGKTGMKTNTATTNANMDSFIVSETAQQQRMIDRQDEELDVLGAHVLRIGELGKEMGQELDAQGELLDEFGYEMMGTQTRLAAAQRKVQHVLDRAGVKGQLAIIAVLVVVLVALLLMVLS